MTPARAARVLQRTWRAFEERTRCRVCFGAGAERLCGCSSRIHRACLERWISASGRTRCEICGAPFFSVVVKMPAVAAPPPPCRPVVALVMGVCAVSSMLMYAVYQLHRLAGA